MPRFLKNRGKTCGTTSDATTIASGSADGTARLWRVADWKPLATFMQLSPRTDEWMLFAPAGYLATSAPGALAWKTVHVKTPPDGRDMMPQAAQRLDIALKT